MKLATWNVNSLRTRMPQVQRWLAEAAPDVVGLQETKVTNDLFPRDALAEAGYPHQAVYGQPSYNGVAIVSRLPLDDMEAGFQHAAVDPQARFVAATVEGVRVMCAYAPNGDSPGSRKFNYKLDWFWRLREELVNSHAAEAEVLVCGDLNVAPADPDVWDPFDAEGELLFSEWEKAAFAKVLDVGLVDAYRTLNPTGLDFTWWDYRGSAFNRNHGFRIDHALVTRPLLERVTSVDVHRHVRAWEHPSDHVPVVVTLR